MTSIQSVLAACTIILIDLLGRAGLDKVLALTSGPAMVALWAQLQSVLEVVTGVAATGVMQGLTILTAQERNPHDEGSLLQSALKLGLGISLSVALALALIAPVLSVWISQREIEPALLLLAVLAGSLATIPATLNAYWLGRHQQQRMVGLSLLLSMVWLLVAAGAWMALPLSGLVLVQCVVLLVIASVIWRYLRKLSQAGEVKENDAAYFRKLMKFVPVGLAIGIMSPASMLLIRGMLSGMLTWDDVGFVQALWRSSDWVTATAAGVLSLIFLPRLSSAYGSARFKSEIMRTAVIVLIPAACLLLLIYLNQRLVLSTLYDVRFVVSNETAAVFMLGSWIRIASWVFLFGLFAAHRTRLIVAGEMLSLPLLALLLWMFANGMTLERTALLYLVSYLVYLGFNAVALCCSYHSHRTH